MRAGCASGLLLAAALLGGTAQGAAAGSCAPWPEWQAFKRLYLSDDGRVVDASTPEAATVSEGQAYALTFALIGNDRPSFARILAWTGNNLSAGDPARVLPAWRWGRTGEGRWSVLDRNSASDADLWMSYALAEAGRLWHEAAYTEAGRTMAALILREETARVPGLGTMVLPGPRGFVSRGTWRLNASYLPIEVLRALGQTGDAALWGEIADSAGRVISGSAPRGYAADWILYREGEGFAADPATHGAGSYNAIRVYLWAGMLAEEEPQAGRIARQLEPMVRAAARGTAPESIDTVTLEAHGEAPAGFLAALLPLSVHLRLDAAVASTRERLRAQALRDNQHYYNDALTLFGLGWLEERFRFDRHGNLRLPWNGSCRAD